MKWIQLLTSLVLCTVSLAEVAPQAEMKAAAENFLATLNDGEKKQAMFPMADPSRENFRFTPRDRTGLRFKEMGPKQREAAMGLLKSALSQKGYLKSTQIMALEGVLAKMENRPEFRDPEKYYVSIFGTPGDAKGWGWKYEGHHLSLNYTVVGDDISVTPSFMGTNPAEVRVGELKGLRVLAKEEDLAIELAKSLLASGNQAVVYTEDTPSEVLTREQRHVEFLKPVGVTAGKMDESQQELLLELIETYVSRHRAPLAKADMMAIRNAGVDQISFAWSGSTEKGKAWYYRIQGPTFLMEAANSQNQANHVHTTWREPNGDYGNDVLGDHYKHGDHKH